MDGKMGGVEDSRPSSERGARREPGLTLTVFVPRCPDATNELIAATTKPCPGCATPTSHYHGHACHHIGYVGGGIGCINCGTHWCFQCGVQHGTARGVAWTGPQKVWGCAHRASFCKSDSTVVDHLINDPYPHDARCGCPICPDCVPDKPCALCNGSCVVCKGFVPPGPKEIVSEAERLARKAAGCAVWTPRVRSLYAQVLALLQQRERWPARAFALCAVTEERVGRELEAWLAGLTADIARMKRDGEAYATALQHGLWCGGWALNFGGREEETASKIRAMLGVRVRT